MTVGTSIETPFQYILGLDGKPVDAGYIYFGRTGLNPETTEIQVYWDEALLIPAAQPVRTQGGYIVRNGTPARIYIDGTNCSMLVRDKNLRLVWSALSVIGTNAGSSGSSGGSGSGGSSGSYSDKYQFTAVGGELLIAFPFYYDANGRNIQVYVNGLRQYVGTHYTESTSSITLLNALEAGDEFLAVANVNVASYVPTQAALSALYALSPTVDSLPYFTGVDSAALTPLSTFVRTLLGASSQQAFEALVGGVGAGYLAITSLTTLTTAQRGVTVDATSGSWALSLPQVASAGSGFFFLFRNSGAGTITIDPYGSEVIDGASTLNAAGGSGFLVLCNGTEWITVGRMASGSGAIVNAQTFSTPGVDTWAKPSGGSLAIVECWGGGGSGGVGGGSNDAGGGGGGGYSRMSFPLASLATTVAVTVGAGGAGGSGNTGGTTSFGTLLTAAGGVGGVTGALTITGGTGLTEVGGSGTRQYSGGNGGSISSVGGISAPAVSTNGGNGGAGHVTTPGVGAQPGGGGGGSWSGTSGAGGAGKCIVTVI